MKYDVIRTDTADTRTIKCDLCRTPCRPHEPSDRRLAAVLRAADQIHRYPDRRNNSCNAQDISPPFSWRRIRG